MYPLTCVLTWFPGRGIMCTLYNDMHFIDGRNKLLGNLTFHKHNSMMLRRQDPLPILRESVAMLNHIDIAFTSSLCVVHFNKDTSYADFMDMLWGRFNTQVINVVFPLGGF